MYVRFIRGADAGEAKRRSHVEEVCTNVDRTVRTGSQ